MVYNANVWKLSAGRIIRVIKIVPRLFFYINPEFDRGVSKIWQYIFYLEYEH
jgi:hypothetical protein